MSKRIITGIDIGTHAVRVVITEHTQGSSAPHVLGVGKSESRGLRHGYIMNMADAVRSVRQAVEIAEEAAGVHVREAYISVGGVGLEGTQARGSSTNSRADLLISEHEVERADHACELSLPQAQNKKVLLNIPIEYTIDNKKVHGRPAGMRGMKLEAKCLVITCIDQHLSDLVRAVEEAGIQPLDACPSPIAASFVALTKSQKMAGCVLANIGAETVSIVVYENAIPISLEVFPVGSTNITNDIALGLKIPLEEAEQIKMGKGGHEYPKKRLTDIVHARLEDMFSLVIAHLKKIEKHELLPAGIVLTGGGSGLETMEDFARGAMHLPSTTPANTIDIPNLPKSRRHGKDTSWFVAYGLTVWGMHNDRPAERELPSSFSSVKEFFLGIFKQFIP